MAKIGRGEGFCAFDQYLGYHQGANPGHMVIAELMRTAELLLAQPSWGAGVNVLGEIQPLETLQGTVTAMGFSKGYAGRGLSTPRSGVDVCWVEVATDVTGEDQKQTVRLHMSASGGKKFNIGQRINLRLFPQ